MPSKSPLELWPSSAGFALPVLHHDELVGKVDARADRKLGRFVVHAIHYDVPSTRAMRDAVHDEIEALAAWLELRLLT